MTCHIIMQIYDSVQLQAFVLLHCVLYNSDFHNVTVYNKCKGCNLRNNRAL